MSESTLERIVPDAIEDSGATGEEALQLHLARYQFAATHVNPGRTLDIACGVGYGTRLLFDTAIECRFVMGVDSEPDCITYAKNRYQREGITFLKGDATTFNSDELFDSVVSLETIEHLPEPTKYLAHLVTLLRPGGVLVASVPTTPTVDANPYHLHDFTERSFREITSSLPLREFSALRQQQYFSPRAILTKSESRLKDLRPNLVAYYTQHPQALLQRIWTTIRHGFAIHYLTLALRYEP